ncbi:hypothetical protein NA57DRAFT_81546 [Rhizodiscina lignyota]|uniref:BTB domain-containing protein n=1 Tax=Rhizodiscina lignyota TaxID=1504668 RepID=A0A9P4M167_9PEZI|nr:hypothetical protein NA57DRAFT_81546 [Rhizodiscina lignyota]
MSAERTVNFTDSFDLTLLVEKNSDATFKAAFQVLSSCVCLASPVFKAMLQGPFKEKNNEAIELPEDDSVALEWILQIAHLRFDTLPTFTKEHILKLAVTGDKYRCLTIFHPWMDQLRTLMYQGAADLATIDGAVFATWVFKDQNAFKRALESAILHSARSEHGLVVKNRTLHDDLLPVGVKDHIMAARRQLLEKIASICRDTRKSLLTYAICASSISNAMWKEECNCLILGAFSRAIHNKFINAEMTRWAKENTTVSGLATSAKEGLRRPPGLGRNDHSACWNRLNPRVAEVDKLLQSVQEYLKFGEEHFNGAKESNLR